MKKIILAPDSFKGTMSSIKICEIMSDEILKHIPDAQIIKIPVADGGEGTVDCFLEAVGGKKVYVTVKGPYFEEIESFYGILSDNETAVIEMAAAAGLPLVENKKDPSKTTTYGVGQLMLHALENGCKKIIIGLGGSCTNDGGVGMASALGVKFVDKSGKSFIPTGSDLDMIDKIDVSSKTELLNDCKVVAACDVDNPLCGIHGAAHIFGPQKGADPDMVKMLDKNLAHLAKKIKSDMDIDLIEIPGTGAAGGLGAGVIAFANATLKPGIQIVLDTVKFDELTIDTDLILTGEGRIDGQSLRGKVVIGVSKRAKKNNIPVIAIVGDIGDDIENVYDEGVSAVMSINRVALPFEKVKERSESDLKATVETLFRILAI